MNVIETINHKHGPRIIVLQNSQVFLEILTRCIKDWFRNPDVVSFENGDDAWAELMRLEPDLLMTDRIHAGMNGEELVWRLAAKEVRYPVLLLSADMPANDELPRSIKLVRQPKPFNRHTLWLTLNGLVGPCDFPDSRPPRNENRSDQTETSGKSLVPGPSGIHI